VEIIKQIKLKFQASQEEVHARLLVCSNGRMMISFLSIFSFQIVAYLLACLPACPE